MRSLFQEWLAARALPAELVPDYSFMVVTAVLVGCCLTLYLWRRSGQRAATAYDLLFFGIIGLFAGAKILFHLQYGFPSTLAGWFQDPGFSLYGGLLGLSGAWAVCYAFRPYRAGLFLDCAAPGLALGLFFGRLGCFLAGCNGGIPTDWPWAVRFPRDTPTFIHQVEAGLIPGSADVGLAVHPTQLYEALFGLVAFFLLLLLMKKKQWDSQAFFTGVLWYTVLRFTIEPIRGDAGGLHPFQIMTFAQFVSLLLAATAAAALWVAANRNAGTGAAVRE